MPRVLVIDDDLLIAETFLFALTQCGFAVRLVVPATDEQLQHGLDWGPEIALLDVDLVVADPVEMVERIHRWGVAAAVIGSERKHETLLRCAQAGAELVVPPNVPLQDLIEMLNKLLATADHGATEIATESLGEPARPLTGRRDIFAVLTSAEQSVLIQLMGGQSTDQIAQREWTPPSIVRSQVRTVLQKLGVNSQLAAVALARQAGWTGSAVSPPSPTSRPGPRADPTTRRY